MDFVESFWASLWGAVAGAVVAYLFALDLHRRQTRTQKERDAADAKARLEQLEREEAAARERIAADRKHQVELSERQREWQAENTARQVEAERRSTREQIDAERARRADVAIARLVDELSEFALDLKRRMYNPGLKNQRSKNILAAERIRFAVRAARIPVPADEDTPLTATSKGIMALQEAYDLPAPTPGAPRDLYVDMQRSTAVEKMGILLVEWRKGRVSHEEAGRLIDEQVREALWVAPGSTHLEY